MKKVLKKLCTILAISFAISSSIVPVLAASQDSSTPSSQKGEGQSIPVLKSFQKDNSGSLPLVKMKDKQFVAGGIPFRFIGTNAPNLVKYDVKDDPGIPQNASIEDTIMSAKQIGVTAIRIFIDWQWASPEELDRILDVARQNGVYIMMAFDLGDWRETAYNRLEKPGSIEEFKKVIEKNINHVNSINGIPYKEDSTIIAWDIGNEPNFSNMTKAEFHSWLDEVTKYVKSLDKNHLVTLGQTYCKFKDSPADKYFEEGYVEAFNVPNLDFMSYHYYHPENSPVHRSDSSKFRFTTPEEIMSDVSILTNEYAKNGKPVVLQEFGYTSGKRFLEWTNLNLTDEEVTKQSLQEHKACLDAAFSNGALGAMFFAWGDTKEKTLNHWTLSFNHNAEEKEFCQMIKDYQVPNGETTIEFQIDNPKMIINGRQVEIDPGKGTAPVTRNDRTLLPIRALIEELGGKVEWSESEKKITITANSKRVELWLGSKKSLVDGIEKQMDVEPQLINDRTMIPLRYVTENLGYHLTWVPELNKIIIRN